MTLYGDRADVLAIPYLLLCSSGIIHAMPAAGYESRSAAEAAVRLADRECGEGGLHLVASGDEREDSE